MSIDKARPSTNVVQPATTSTAAAQTSADLSAWQFMTNLIPTGRHGSTKGIHSKGVGRSRPEKSRDPANTGRAAPLERWWLAAAFGRRLGMCQASRWLRKPSYIDGHVDGAVEGQRHHEAIRIDCRTKTPPQWLKLLTARTLAWRSTNSMPRSTPA
ncbi:hypothetical protein [Mycobacterium sp. 852002-10029_SCH5224772]|uniref:hypothetical protein n=1 Tax=Mycobacterium sp. 852002-10029_SCH5224772 TaxID=1834083 RepID=UPI0018D43D62|nr:hypothetical protein [Mycobacterium sp. 852002-10029_SCH5224772]